MSLVHRTNCSWILPAAAEQFRPLKLTVGSTGLAVDPTVVLRVSPAGLEPATLRLGGGEAYQTTYGPEQRGRIARGRPLGRILVYFPWMRRGRRFCNRIGQFRGAIPCSAGGWACRLLQWYESGSDGAPRPTGIGFIRTRPRSSDLRRASSLAICYRLVGTTQAVIGGSGTSAGAMSRWALRIVGRNAGS